MSTDTNDTNDTSEQQERSPGPPPDDPIRRALQYRWLSTDQWHDRALGLLEACGSRHDVELVLIQAEQGYWAGDFDSYGRTPSWLRRLQARGQPPKAVSPPMATVPSQ
jgi:hypothetical protein